ncbi:MAG: response regulator [Pseudomonadota bacterium]
MPVVHGILRDHQAAITVKTRPDAGSVFTVIFRAADTQDDANVQAQELLDDVAVGDLPRTPGAPLSTILYVDDDELITGLVERMLKRAGFPVHMYASSSKALDDVRSGAAGYDLAVVDYTMPGMNGLELAKALRRLHPDKPVAITSGLISEELRRNAPQAGITELIHKTNTGTDLLDAISRLARRVAPGP